MFASPFLQRASLPRDLTGNERAHARIAPRIKAGVAVSVSATIAAHQLSNLCEAIHGEERSMKTYYILTHFSKKHVRQSGTAATQLGWLNYFQLAAIKADQRKFCWMSPCRLLLLLFVKPRIALYDIYNFCRWSANLLSFRDTGRRFTCARSEPRGGGGNRHGRWLIYRENATAVGYWTFIRGKNCFILIYRKKNARGAAR